MDMTSDGEDMKTYQTAEYNKADKMAELMALLPGVEITLTSDGEAEIKPSADLSAATKAQVEAIIGKTVTKV